MKKTTLKALGIAVVAVAATLSITACSEQAPVEPIRLAGIPLDDQQDTAAGYVILSQLIEEATGRPVEFFDTSDYGSVTEALLAGQVDIAQIPSFGYVVAKEKNENIGLLGVGARDKGKVIGSLSYGITRADNTSINSLTDLKGKDVCLSDPSSSAGYLWPAKFLIEDGVNPRIGENPDFEMNFVGSFPQVASSVEIGDCDAGFILDSFFDETLQKSDLVDVNNLRIFWKSPVSPGSPLVFDSASITAEEERAIKDILVAKGNKDYLVEQGVCEEFANCKILSASTWGYVLVEDEFFDPIRDLCARLELDQC